MIHDFCTQLQKVDWLDVIVIVKPLSHSLIVLPRGALFSIAKERPCLPLRPIVEIGRLVKRTIMISWMLLLGAIHHIALLGSADRPPCVFQSQQS